MEFNKNNRFKELEELQNFTEGIDGSINNMIKSVGWSIESIENFTPLFECPFNSSHQISEKRLEEHLERCQWKAEGYGEQDIPLSEPSVSCETASCVKFDEQLLEEVLQEAKLKNPIMQIGAGNRLIPRTSDRLISDFTADERRAVYEYIVAKTIKPNVGEDITDLNKPKKDNDGNKSTSYLELLAQERNLKRRRAKHRGVHTNKKSHVEILREIINQQMEMLEEYVADKNDCKAKENKNNAKEAKPWDNDVKEDVNEANEAKDTKNKDSTRNKRKKEHKINSENERRNSKHHHNDHDHRDRDNDWSSNGNAGIEHKIDLEKERMYCKHHLDHHDHDNDYHSNETEGNEQKVDLEKERRDYKHHNRYHDRDRDCYSHDHRSHHSNSDYYYYNKEGRKDSLRHYEDVCEYDYEYSKHSHTSSRDDTKYHDRSRKYHSEDRKRQNHEKSDKSDRSEKYSRYSKQDDKYNKHNKYDKYDEKHVHRSRDRDSSRHSSKSTHEDRKAGRRKH